MAALSAMSACVSVGAGGLVLEALPVVGVLEPGEGCVVGVVGEVAAVAGVEGVACLSDGDADVADGEAACLDAGDVAIGDASLVVVAVVVDGEVPATAAIRIADDGTTVGDDGGCAGAGVACECGSCRAGVGAGVGVAVAAVGPSCLVSLVGEVGAEDDAPSVHARFSPFDWSEPVRLRLRLVPLLDDDDDDDEDDAGAETAVGDATCIVSVVAEEVESVEAAMVLVFDGATDCGGVVVVVGAGEASDSVDGDATVMASELARSIVLVVAAVVGHLMRQEALDRMGKRARLSTKRSLSHSLSAAVVLVAKALQQARREEVRSERRAARGGEGEERGVEGGGRGRNERERERRRTLSHEAQAQPSYRK